ncbi:MAG: hypothetical protein ACLSAH_23505 [Bilophila wadsworthia]
MSVTLMPVITQAAIDAVAKEGFLFTVDPASRPLRPSAGTLRKTPAVRSPSNTDDAGQPAFVAHGDADRRDHQH